MRAAGYRVARVRTIFSLPPEIQRLRVHNRTSHVHLAYVELFSSFTDTPDSRTGLYKVMPLRHRLHGTRAVVVPIAQIFRSCHLIPVSGSAIDRSLSSDNVLDRHDTFFLNSFSDHHMYLFV